MSSLERDFINRMKSINVEIYKNLVDKFELHFKCASCDTLPTKVAYISTRCSHYVCVECANSLDLPEMCLKCGEQIIEENLVIDPLYFIFYECFKNRYVPRISERKWTLEVVRHFKRKLDLILQDECRKLFRMTGGDIENVKLLINVGANPNVLNRDGCTLMHEAVDCGNASVLEVLLEGGGIVNAYSLDKCSTCLHDALDDIVNQEIVSVLIDYGANVELKDGFGLTALNKAENREYILNILKRPRIHNMPLKTKPMGTPIIYGCNLNPDYQRMLNNFCRHFKLKQCRQKIGKDVTHVIVEDDPCFPSYDVFMGILQGCFIVKFQWIADSLRTMSIINPEPYEVTGTIEFPMSNAARRSRINSAYLKPQLFAGGQFKISDSFQERFSLREKEELTAIITAGGGKVLTRAKTCGDNIGETFFYHANGGPLQFCNVIVIHKIEPDIGNWESIGHANIQWLYNCIQNFKILP